MGPLTASEINALHEARHVEALRGLFDRYGLSRPANPWLGEVTRRTSRQGACAAGAARRCRWADNN